MFNIYNYLYLILGAIAGAGLRHSSNLMSHLPYSTAIVNSLGCFLAGLFLAGKIPYLNPSINSHKVFLITGLCGSLTTFSTLIVEIFDLLNTGLFFKAAIYVIMSLVSGLFFLYLGLKI